MSLIGFWVNLLKDFGYATHLHQLSSDTKVSSLYVDEEFFFAFAVNASLSIILLSGDCSPYFLTSFIQFLCHE